MAALHSYFQLASQRRQAPTSPSTSKLSFGARPLLLFFFDVLFLLLVAYALILKALRFPDKPAGLTSVGNVLIGAVPRSRVSSRNCTTSGRFGPPPTYNYFPLTSVDARIKYVPTRDSWLPLTCKKYKCQNPCPSKLPPSAPQCYPLYYHLSLDASPRVNP